jgi:uncharacterized protein YicC (UPF0701 family)
MLKPLLLLQVLLYRIWSKMELSGSLKSKSILKSTLIFCMAVLMAVSGCSEKKDNDSERVKEKWKEAADETKKYLDQKGQVLKKDVDETINDFDNKIKDLKEKLSSKSGEGKDKIQKQIDDLEIQKNDLKNNLEKAGDNAKESWNNFKTETRDALSDIEKEIDSLK